jgi:hypothetical protein
VDTSPLLSAFELLVLALYDSFTKRSGRYVLALMLAWVVTPGRKTLKRIFRFALLRRARTGMYRFFSGFKWDYIEVARGVLGLALAILGPGRVTLIVDDTLSPKSGPKIFGASLHCDHHVLRKPLFWGHNWVIVALGIRVPGWKRWIGLPLLAELYIREKEARKLQEPFRTKLQIAVGMIEALTRDLEKPLLVVADGAYTNGAVILPLKKLKERGIVFVGRLRSDAVLYPLPPKRRRKKPGPRPRWGRRLPKLSRLARRLKFRKVPLDIYSETVSVWAAEHLCVWPHADGAIKVVIVKKSRRDPEPAYLMTTDTTMSAEEVIVAFSGRWPIEIAIRNAKTELGLGQARVRTKRSVLRVTNLCLWIQSLLILAWVKVHGFAAATAAQVQRGNAHKTTPSFADMLLELRDQITAQRVLRSSGGKVGIAKKILRLVRPLLEAI